MVSGNIELYGRTVWATRTGLAFGGGLGLMAPVATYDDNSPASRLASAATTLRPWDVSFFASGNFAIRPFVDVRVIEGRFTIQFREGLDFSFGTNDGYRQTTALTGLYAGYRVTQRLSAGVEAFELYNIDGNIADALRANVVVSPSVRLMTPFVQPALSLFTNIGKTFEDSADRDGACASRRRSSWTRRTGSGPSRNDGVQRRRPRRTTRARARNSIRKQGCAQGSSRRRPSSPRLSWAAARRARRARTTSPKPPPPVSSAPPPVADTRDDQAIAEACKAFIDFLPELSPEGATLLGLHPRDADLDDRTAEGAAEVLAREEALLQVLRTKFAKPVASAAKLTDLALLLSAVEVDVETKKALRPLERQPDVYAAPMNAIFMMSAREYAPAEERAKAALERIEKIPAAVRAARENSEGPAEGPRRGGHRAGEVRGRVLRRSTRLPRWGAPARAGPHRCGASWREEGLRALRRRSSRRTCSRARRASSAPAARSSISSSAASTSSTTTPTRSRLAAQPSSARTRDELDVVARRIDPQAKSWFEVADRLKKTHPRAEELLDSYRAEVQRARRFVVEKDAVPLPPGDDCQVIETPVFERSTIVAEYDGPPAFDPTTRGFFFVTPIDTSLPVARQEETLREHDHGDQVNTTVHETYPGHHVQLSLARASTRRPCASSPRATSSSRAGASTWRS